MTIKDQIVKGSACPVPVAIVVLFFGTMLAACGVDNPQAAELHASTSATTAAAGAAIPGAPAASAVASAATFREVVVPAGTLLRLRLDTSVGSDTSRVEQPVRAHIDRPIRVDGVMAIPIGSTVSGTVTDAQRSGKVKGRAHIAMRFDSLSVNDAKYSISTQAAGRTAPATKKKDALQIGVPAAGGAIVGALVGGKKGAAVGGVAGGGAGSAYVLSTRGKEARLGRGALLSVRLTEPLRVRVPMTKG